jgi:RTX calcium-binding nonapeptide repeat (4 copies)
MRKSAVIVAVVATLALCASPAGAKQGDIIVGDSTNHVVLSVNPRTGAKSLVSNDPRLVDPSDTVFGRDGTIYVVDYEAFDGGGGVFSIDPRTGKTRVVTKDPLFEQPDGIGMAPNGDLYVTDLANPQGALFRVQLPSGKTSVASNDPLLAGGPLGVVVPPSGNPIVADSGPPLLARVDPLTGTATTIADAGDGLVGGEGLTRGPDGTLYMADSTAGVVSIDPGSGKVTDLTDAVPTDGYGLAFDLRGRVITQAGVDIYRVNLRTSHFESISTGFGYPEGMEVEPPTCEGQTATMPGTSGSDPIKGSRFGDVIAGIGGRDTLKGKAGNDRVCGGKGNDKITDDQGKNRIDCGPGKHDVATTNGESSTKSCERVRRSAGIA